MARLDLPTYVRIAQDLRDQIASGELQPGARLPSEAHLTRQYQVARETARKALNELRHEGLAVTRQGHGTFVRDAAPLAPVAMKPGDQAVARMPTPDEQRDLGLSEGTPVIVVTAASGKKVVYAASAAMLTTN